MTEAISTKTTISSRAPPGHTGTRASRQNEPLDQKKALFEIFEKTETNVVSTLEAQPSSQSVATAVWLTT